MIECKDLKFTRNHSEMAALLSDYQGRDKEKVPGKYVPDKLKRHLQRVALLNQNVTKLEQFTDLDNARVISCVCFSGLVPMQYAKIDALDGTAVGSIDEVLDSLRLR